MGGETMEASLAVVVVACRVELVGPMAPAAIHDHHDVFAGVAEGGHDLMELWAELLGVQVGHDFREDLRRTLLDRADDAEEDAAGEATPRAILQPRLAFERLSAFALPLAQRTSREACTRRCPPPARAGQGTAPEAGVVCREHNDLTTTRLVLAGGKCASAVSEISRGGIPAASGAGEASVVFFHTPRTRSRPIWTPVCWANTVARARPCHWEWLAPCCSGS